MSRIWRIPKRLAQDAKIISSVKNWREILSAKVFGSAVSEIKFSNGVVLRSPPEVDLAFLYHEVWLDEVYCPSGYKIKDGDIVLDIGANIGVFAAYAATRAKNVKVTAFEPFPENFAFLENNINSSNLQNVDIRDVAVSGKSGKSKLFISDTWIKNSLNESQAESQSSIEITCVTLDEILKETDRCDFLKIDCEGSEYEIFYSMPAQSIEKIKRIVGEYHDLDTHKKNGIALRQFLENHNFRFDKFIELASNNGLFCATNQSFEAG